MPTYQSSVLRSLHLEAGPCQVRWVVATDEPAALSTLAAALGPAAAAGIVWWDAEQVLETKVKVNIFAIFCLEPSRHLYSTQDRLFVQSYAWALQIQ